MGESSQETPRSDTPPDVRLDSWKEIAAYLNRDITTVQRWERREGMPVHRHVHEKKGSVYAFARELDAWTRSRSPAAGLERRNGDQLPVPVEPGQTRWKAPVIWLAAVSAVLAVSWGVWLDTRPPAWRDPIAGGRFQRITSFGGDEQAAAISRDGRLAAFLSDHDGPMDVWVTQIGSGEFHNLTHGSAPELVNPSIRTLGFSPDGSLVTFWARRLRPSGQADIGVWAVPTLGGQPRPYLEGVAEFDWSSDARQLAYHTTAPGDPLFISDGTVRPDARPIFRAPAGTHNHFPVWAPGSAFLYTVEGELPDKLSIWRMTRSGGERERITEPPARISYPVVIDPRTLLYLAADPDGAGPWLYGVDVQQRVPHRVSTGPERYTSLASSADGRRLVLTLATATTTLWNVALGDDQPSKPAQIPLDTGSGSSPRQGADYIVYFSSNGTSGTVWKSAAGATTNLWSGDGVQFIGGAAVSRNGAQIAFSVRKDGHALLYVMQSDGSEPRILTDTLDLRDSPAWSPDGHAIATAATEQGIPHLFLVPLAGGPPARLTSEYAVDPAWAPDGSVIIYSGPDVGTTFSLKAIPRTANAQPWRPLTLTRGARHIAFLSGTRGLVVLRGEIDHKNLWSIDLQTGAERQLTDFPADFDVRDFDLSPDGRSAVVERAQDRSDIVLLDLPRR